jgi:hypothetical protein
LFKIPALLISYTVIERGGSEENPTLTREISYDEDLRKDLRNLNLRNAVLSNAMEATQSVMIK